MKVQIDFPDDMPPEAAEKELMRIQGIISDPEQHLVAIGVPSFWREQEMHTFVKLVKQLRQEVTETYGDG